MYRITKIMWYFHIKYFYNVIMISFQNQFKDFNDTYHFYLILIAMIKLSLIFFFYKNSFISGNIIFNL